MKLLQLNLSCNWGSTGRIAEDIGRIAISKGWESYIAHGAHFNDSFSTTFRVSSSLEIKLHHLQSRILDMQGLGSKRATRKFIDYIDGLQPDIIHLHNIHGSWINYPILFSFLKQYGSPVVWTLHDSWAFTGHCAIFEHNNCFEWEHGCKKCNFKDEYPPSAILSRSASNFKTKKESFLSIADKLTIVPVSYWLENYVRKSFLSQCEISTIHNGIDLNKFKVSQKHQTKLILGVANAWGARKGLYDFLKLRDHLSPEYAIKLVGMTNSQIASLPSGIEGIARTQSVEELAMLYSSALAFVNPTYSDNYPTTNLEAMACGTPVITYNTGGSPEAVDKQTGIVIDKGDINGIVKAIQTIETEEDNYTSEICRLRAEREFDMNLSYEKYFSLYNYLLNKV